MSIYCVVSLCQTGQWWYIDREKRYGASPHCAFWEGNKTKTDPESRTQQLQRLWGGWSMPTRRTKRKQCVWLWGGGLAFQTSSYLTPQGLLGLVVFVFPFPFYFCNSGLCPVPQTCQAPRLLSQAFILAVPSAGTFFLQISAQLPFSLHPFTCHTSRETFPTTECKVVLLSLSCFVIPWHIHQSVY